jgi:superfamily I DNA/RNA helicase
MEKAIEVGGLGPEQIGLLTFTVAAAEEGRMRAAEKFGCDKEALRHFGTIHSICFRNLENRGELLTEDKKSRAWLTEKLQDVFSAPEDPQAESLGAFCTDNTANYSESAKALALWQLARQRLTSIETVWREAQAQNASLVPLEKAKSIVRRYESAKLLDNMIDFTDMLSLWAGWKCHVDGCEAGEPQGDCPAIPVLLFDEQQDNTPLLNECCHRLLHNPASRWAYVVGDPFQSIYSFMGANGQLFMSWQVGKEGTLPKSWRCGKAVLDLGEAILRQQSTGYFDRGIKPSDHASRVEEYRNPGLCIQESGISPKDSWLLLARTNKQAQRWANLLNEAGVPWVPTRGNGGWKPTKKTLATSALMQLQDDFPITYEEWRAILDNVPVKCPLSRSDLLAKGVKTRWIKPEYKPGPEFASLGDLEHWGATEYFRQVIKAGGWARLIQQADDYIRAVRRWGIAAVGRPQIRVGTVHSVKGAEADNVAVLTTTGPIVGLSTDIARMRDEELRIGYVAATRARHRLLIVNNPRERFKMEMGV